MALSTVPAVLEALVSTAAAALPGVAVFDGQPDRDIPDECVVIGFTGNGLEAAVEDTRTVEEITRARDRERYEVFNLATSWLGEETDMVAVRLRAFALVDAIAARIAADHTLGGACGKCRVSVVGLSQMQTGQGAVATILFTVAVDAFTGRP
jgi:hypothetical protein